MATEIMQYFTTISEIQSCIAKAQTLDAALQDGLRAIVKNCQAEAAVIWYADKSDNDTLHPTYWIGPEDLTSCTHAPGEGSVGRVYTTQKAERLLDFSKQADPQTQADFESMNVTSMVCVPFSTLHEELGCIQLVNKTDGSLWSDEEADVAEIMSMSAAMAIEQNEQLQGAWTPGKTIIEVRNVTREFQNGDVLTKVLKGVNLNVYEGEFLVLLGESGCGKSTLLNIIGGMDRATSGSFTFRGTELGTASAQELTEYRRDNIGFIFQSYNLMPNLTALQNLRLIAELVDNPMNCEHALQLVGLGDRMNSYPSQLSGGQQQRVSIARALVKNPKIIFADEPTAALDYATSVEVLSAMERIVAEGTTLVMVTHNEEITRMADRVVRLRGGKTHEITVNRHPVHATELVW